MIPTNPSGRERAETPAQALPPRRARWVSTAFLCAAVAGATWVVPSPTEALGGAEPRGAVRARTDAKSPQGRIQAAAVPADASPGETAEPEAVEEMAPRRSLQASQEQPLTPQERAALELVERILVEDDRLLSGEFTYDSGGRRDPFRSLLQPSRSQEVAPADARPQGVAGLLVQDARVTGIARYLGGWHAVLTAPDGRTYFARVGAELYDGRIVEIGPEEVVFEQEVEDVIGNRRVRQVVKRLRTE